MRFLLLLVLFQFGFGKVCAQSDSLRINVKVLYNQQEILLDDKQVFEYRGAPISFSTLKFYLSNFCFTQSGKPLGAEVESFHLINPEDSSSLAFNIAKPKHLNTLHFTFGIDSSTNVSGAMGGDLDPTKGMYWTWQSGYVNFKLEGTSPLAKTRKNEFQFHLGGYTAPFASAQNLAFDISKNCQSITIIIDLELFLNQIDLAETNTIMSPSAKAVVLSELLAKTISVHEN